MIEECVLLDWRHDDFHESFMEQRIQKLDHTN